MAKEPFVLAFTEDLTCISAPLKSTQRIKYTCFDASNFFIVFGATSGGLYVFKRSPCAFLQLLPNKDGAITRVAISPNEKFFAFASVKGVVCVLELNEGPGARRLLVSNEHHDHDVSVLLWNTRSDELFAGDNEGRVSVITVSLFSAKPMFPVPPFQLMQLDSRIVQMDWCAELLLVSTLTRCYICDTVKEQYRQIGQKLREGDFGACFSTLADCAVPRRPELHAGILDRSSFISVGEGDEPQGGCDGLQHIRLFCARPGSRLWEGDAQGTVLRTHQFKDALAIPPAPIVNLSSPSCLGSQSSAACDKAPSSTWGPQSFNFPRLYTISRKFLMTFRQSGVYIFNPEDSSVLLWSDAVKDIVDGKVVRDTMYLYTSSGDVRALTLSSVEKILVKLYFQKEYLLCADMCFIHQDYLLSQVPKSPKLYLLSDLANKIESIELVERISPLLETISKLYDDKKSSVKLESGIVVIGNKHYLAKEDEDHLRNRLATFVEESVSKEKSRSLNTSPKMMRHINVAAKHKSGSTSSLPEVLQNSNSSSSRVLSDEHVFTSPEAVHSLKEIGQTVSGKFVTGTKTLKEKWHVLESKMKFLGSNARVELIGIRSENNVDDFEESHDPHDENSEDVVYNKCVHRYPALDISEVLDVCQEINRNNVENMTENGLKFLSGMMSLCKRFSEAVESKEKFSTYENGTSFHMHHEIWNHNHSNRIDTTWKRFPFHHYFQGDSLQLVHDTLHNLFQLQLVITFVQTLECEELLPVPDQLLSVYKLVELELDAKLSQVLIAFSDIIDPDQMLQNIKILNLPCYYKSLTILLDLCQKGKQVQIKDAENEKHSLMMQLNIILMMLRMDQVETCSNMGDAVHLKDVFYLILRVQEMSVESGVDCNKAKMNSHNMFLSLINKSPREEHVLLALQDADLSAFVISAYEELNGNTAYSCQCGYPAPQPPEPQFVGIGRMILDHLQNVGSPHTNKFLHRIPGMWRYNLDPKANACSTSNLSLIIHLGEVSLLEELLPHMTAEEWSVAFETFAKFQSGFCLNCDKPGTWTKRGDGITWSLFSLQAVRCLGPGPALKLVGNYSDCIRPGELDARFFQGCIFSAIVDKHVTGLRDRIVDMLMDSSGKKSSRAIMSHEVSTALEEALSLDTGEPPAPTVGPQPGDHHWGVGVDLRTGRCPICWLPLGSLVLLQDGELVVFRCGHAYHSVCLQQRGLGLPSCLLCDTVRPAPSAD